MTFRRALGSISAMAGTLAALASLSSISLTAGCENVSEPVRVEGQVHLTLLHTSDIHSRLFPYNLQLGQVDAGLGLGQALTLAHVRGRARTSPRPARRRPAGGGGAAPGLGQALPIANVGGAARISHILGRERARASRVLHLDG